MIDRTLVFGFIADSSTSRKSASIIILSNFFINRSSVLGRSSNCERRSSRFKESRRVKVILVSGSAKTTSDGSHFGVIIPIPCSLGLCSKGSENGPDWMWTLGATMNTDLNPIPFSPIKYCSPPLVLLLSPILQIARTFSVVKPSSLESMTICLGRMVNLMYGFAPVNLALE